MCINHILTTWTIFSKLNVLTFLTLYVPLHPFIVTNHTSKAANHPDYSAIEKFYLVWSLHKWNYTLCVLWCLASFLLHYLCGIESSSGSYLLIMTEHSVVRLQYITHSSVDIHVGCFHSEAITNSNALDIFLHI